MSINRRYLKALLVQEAEWYEKQNVEQLPSKVNSELKDIEIGSGKSVGFIIFAFSMSTSAYVASFFMAGTLAACTCIVIPLFIIVGLIYGVIMMRDSYHSEMRYQKSGAHAEQALSAIKVVKAFGQEKSEIDSYNYELDKTSASGKIQAILVGFANGLIELLIYFLTAFSLFVGAMFVKERVSIIIDRLTTTVYRYITIMLVGTTQWEMSLDAFLVH